MREVPFFDYPDVYGRFREGFLQALDEVGRRGAFIMQSDLVDFERELADYLGARHVVGVANATDGLQLGFMAGGLARGDEVLISSHTMVATAAAVHFAGGVPVPVDVGGDHLIDLSSAARALTPRTRAICPTQLNGRTCNMDAIGTFADQHGLLVFEDAAQALGSRYDGRAAGTFGRAACISFYPAKVLGCLGDGGAVVTGDDAVAERLRLLRDHGRSERGTIDVWGFNSRLDNLQAAFLRLQFQEYPRVVCRRREIAARYDERLRVCPSLELPPPPDEQSKHFDIYQNYEIRADRRDELRAWLADRGIGTLIQWGGVAIHQLEKIGCRVDLPATDAMFAKMLMLPINMTLSDEDVEYVIDQVLWFYA